MSRRGDPRPERERYQHASWSERLGGDLRALRHHPGVLLAIGVVLGGGLFLNLVRPQVVGVRDLVPGECLYIRAADADSDAPGGRPIGTSSAAVAALYGQGAERTACDQSHSHEVLLATTFVDDAVAAYPGAADLAGRMRGDCEAAFSAYVGHDVAGSELDLVIAVPDASAWAAPVRQGVCLVARRDGDFLTTTAKGSGR